MILRALLLASALLTHAHAGEDRAPVPPLRAWQDIQPAPLREFAAPAVRREVLSSGAVLFLHEDHELPLVGLTAVFRGGQYEDPPAQAGLAGILATVLRSGGSTDLPGDRLDEALEDRAASIWTAADMDSWTAGLTCLNTDLERVLDLFAGMLKRPAYPEDKLDLALAQARTAVAKRNDQPTGIAQREFTKALYGKKNGAWHPLARHTEYDTLNAIRREDLLAAHRARCHPRGMILSVWGAFDSAALRARLERACADWPWPPPPVPEAPAVDDNLKREARTVFVERPRINQTTLLLGHGLDVRRNHADYPALQYLNEILSGGMGARMFTEVRTKKGLAYSVWGYARVPYNRPGMLSCGCMTRNEQAFDALDAVREEVTRMRDNGVTEREVENTRESFVNAHAFNYDAPEKILALLRTHEFHGYPLDFDRTHFAALRKVTKEDVDRVAKKHLEPGKFLVLAVGGDAGYPKPWPALGKVETLDVTIPVPKQAPLVLDPEREARGRRFLEAALKAAGGVKPFQDIKTMRCGLLLHAGPLKLKGALSIAVPERVRADVAGPFGPITQIVGRGEAWQASGAWVKPSTPEEARKNLRNLLQTDLGILRVLAAGQEGYNVQAVDPLRDGERILPGVLLESASLGRIRAYFDEQTWLLARLRYIPEGQAKEAEKVFSGHRPFGALVLAARCEDSDPKARARVVELTALTINPHLDDALFQKPAQATPPKGDE